MGVFSDKLNDAKVGAAGGVFFCPMKTSSGDREKGLPPEYRTGKYKIRAEVLKEFESRDGKELFVCETIILESNVAERPAQTRCSYMMNINKDAAAQNIKALLAALNGLDPNVPKDAAAIAGEDWKAVYEAATGKENPCRGMECLIEVFYRKKKTGPAPTGGDKANDPAYYTHHVFYPVAKAEAAE